MKQFEYITPETVTRSYEDVKRGCTTANGRLERTEPFSGSFNAYLNKLGKEGWEFQAAGGNGFAVFGKREIQERTIANSWQNSTSVSR